MTKFAELETARRIIRKLYPESQNVTFIEHGYDNLVGLVDQRYAIKFPRNEYALLRDEYEKMILLDLADLEDFSIPKVLGESHDPAYVITSFVPGDFVSSDEILIWLPEIQKKFSEKLAKFAFLMHSQLSTEKAFHDQRKIGLDDFHGYEYYLSKFDLPNPEQNKIIRNYYQIWKNLQYTTRDVVVHDDLQTLNLLFKNQELTGVIDFGDAGVGKPEQDLRQLYRLSETLVEVAAKEYEKLSGQKLNIEAIKIWGIVQELSAYINRYFKKEFDSAPFKRATKNLQKWLPEVRWEI